MKTLGEYIAESNISGVMKAYNGQSIPIDTPYWYKKSFCTTGSIVRTKALKFVFGNNSIVLHWFNEDNRPNGFYRLAYVTIDGRSTEFKYDELKKVANRVGRNDFSHLLHDEGKRNVSTELSDFLKYCKTESEKGRLTVDGVINKFAECIRRNNITFDLDD